MKRVGISEEDAGSSLAGLSLPVADSTIGEGGSGFGCCKFDAAPPLEPHSLAWINPPADTQFSDVACEAAGGTWDYLECPPPWGNNCECCVTKLCFKKEKDAEMATDLGGRQFIDAPFEITVWFSMVGVGPILPCSMEFWENATFKVATYKNFIPGEWNAAHKTDLWKTRRQPLLDASMSAGCAENNDDSVGSGKMRKVTFIDSIKLRLGKGWTEAFAQHFRFCSGSLTCPILCLDIFVIHVISRDADGVPKWEAYVTDPTVWRVPMQEPRVLSLGDLAKKLPKLQKAGQKYAVDSKKDKCIP